MTVDAQVPVDADDGEDKAPSGVAGLAEGLGRVTSDVMPAPKAGDGARGEAATDGVGMTAVDRQSAFAGGVPKMPRRVIYLAVAAVLALGLGGTLLDRLVTTPSPSHTSAHSAVVVPAVHPTPPTDGTQLTAPLSAFLGITSLKGKAAPALSLTNARTGAAVSLLSLRGHAVVLTFINAACNDICPVLASELRQAQAELGVTTAPVTFVTVNTDPLDLQSTAATILSQPTLAAIPDWQFLTGSIGKLNPIWKAYDIGITADSSTGVASHNDLMYFIGTDGKMSWSATPFADESTSGSFSLPSGEIARFAQGIAHYADQLAGAR